MLYECGRAVAGFAAYHDGVATLEAASDAVAVSGHGWLEDPRVWPSFHLAFSM